MISVGRLRELLRSTLNTRPVFRLKYTFEKKSSGRHNGVPCLNYPNIPIPLQEISIDFKTQFGYRKNVVSASLASQYVGLPLTPMNNLHCRLIHAGRAISYQLRLPELCPLNFLRANRVTLDIDNNLLWNQD